MSSQDLARVFRAHLRDQATFESTSDEELERVLEGLTAQGARAWPQLTIDAPTLVTRLASRLPPSATKADLLSFHVRDFYLASACAQGDAKALRFFDSEFIAEIGKYVSNLTTSDAFVAEVKQRVREKLLIADAAEEPRVGDYNGVSPLGAWMRVIATRIALSALRKTKGEPVSLGDFGETGSGTTALLPHAPDPEVDVLQLRYRDVFRAAFQATIEALPVDERNLLRMHYLDGMSIDHLGALFGVHRSTTARRIAQCREQILLETRRRLREHVELTSSEVDSVMRAMQSELEQSIHVFFDEKGPG